MKKVFVTGGTGFVGPRLIARLQKDSAIEHIAALARSEATARRLQGLGCEPRKGDLTDLESLIEAMKGCDAVVHLAGDVHTGIAKEARPQMRAVNVDGTRNVLDAAEQTDVDKTVVISTINVFGDTQGNIVDETYRRPSTSPWRSFYEETKSIAHELALVAAQRGQPVVVALPGMIYGPDDPSTMGKQIRGAAKGKLPAIFLGNLGLDMVHVDDVADGIVRALANGKVGEQYLLTGDKRRVREVLGVAAAQTGASFPRLDVPDFALRAIARLGPLLKPLGFPPNPREVVAAASGGKTYWGSWEKAHRELGYNPRSLNEGLLFLEDQR